MASPFPIPLNALRAIEIVARRGALAPAAEELGVTIGAVSQHLRRAEERLGMELFERTPAGLRPLPALKAALPQLAAGFAALQDGLGSLKGSDEGVLNLTVGSVFASRWLIWRINKFTAENRDIEVRLNVTAAMLDLSRPDVDCGIRYGHGQWPGVNAELVGGTAYQPVCAPVVAEHLKHPADLAHVPVIQDETTMLSWDAWRAEVGLDPAIKLSGPVYSDASLAFDAAISEQGVLMAADMMSADAVSDGRLVRPFAHSVDGPQGYWLVTAKGRRESRKIRAFRDWLKVEVPASVRGYVYQSRG
ncbi:LysR substrate-binding domain-containing protein [Devosia ginsengisoli]|uniref:LysR substrate-binding domain-containing protein n=1 Tax=Devosia ginsengisoli TaxID=400770 RepID=UPI0026ED786C|nr:LysR substrate-binding domain-containing protein [Devosia ginsengisoli]MCR6656556.1 LysR substrate-binding domain-containing protein [Opitutus sp.]MCR6670995.1 LysR substrate-binding domain-containing protein [Devosia ginsengisoli]